MIRYIQSVILPSKLAQLLIQTGMKWNQDDCSGMAAALSFHALFSLFPMLLVALSVVGSLLGSDTAAFEYVTAAAGRFLPPEVRGLVKETLIVLNQSSIGAGMIGFSLLLYSASTVFSVLSTSVNKIWRSQHPISEPTSIFRATLSFLLNRFWSVLFVFGAVWLLLVSLIAGTAIQIILKLVDTFQETFSFIYINELQLAKGLQVVLSLTILTLVICFLFKILPSVSVAWRDVWTGGVLTAFLLVGLQQLISNTIIAIGSHYLPYGVIGGVMILLLWINLTCQIFFLGCEFSYIYAQFFGSHRRWRISRSNRLS
jgi:membrane protein